METLIKTQDQGTDGKGKKIVDDEGFSSVRKEGSSGLGVGSRPGLGGRMPTLSTVVSKQHVKVRTQEEVVKCHVRVIRGSSQNCIRLIEVV